MNLLASYFILYSIVFPRNFGEFEANSMFNEIIFLIEIKSNNVRELEMNLIFRKLV